MCARICVLIIRIFIETLTYFVLFFMSNIIVILY